MVMSYRSHQPQGIPTVQFLTYFFLQSAYLCIINASKEHNVQHQQGETKVNKDLPRFTGPQFSAKKTFITLFLDYKYVC